MYQADKSDHIFMYGRRDGVGDALEYLHLFAVCLCLLSELCVLTYCDCELKHTAAAPTTALYSTFLKPLQITHTLQHVSAVLLLPGSSGSMGPRCDSDSSCLCMMWSSPAPKRNALRTPDEAWCRGRACPPVKDCEQTGIKLRTRSHIKEDSSNQQLSPCVQPVTNSFES